MLASKTADDLWRIVAGSGGLDFDANRFTTDELWRMASASKKSGAKLIFRGIGHRANDELWRLGVAGGGNVSIAD